MHCPLNILSLQRRCGGKNLRILWVGGSWGNCIHSRIYIRKWIHTECCAVLFWNKHYPCQDSIEKWMWHYWEEIRKCNVLKIRSTHVPTLLQTQGHKVEFYLSFIFLVSWFFWSLYQTGLIINTTYGGIKDWRRKGANHTRKRERKKGKRHAETLSTTCWSRKVR